MYAISYQQLCTICQDENNLINSSLEHTSIDSETLIKHKAKLLKCNHLFHYECINKFFWGGGKNCPNCRAPIDEEDTHFRATKDPYGFGNKPLPKGWETYISKDKHTKSTFIFENIPKHLKDHILKNEDSIVEEVKQMKPTVSFTIPLSEINHLYQAAESRQVPQANPGAQNPEVDYWIDEKGICHQPMTPPENN